MRRHSWPDSFCRARPIDSNSSCAHSLRVARYPGGGRRRRRRSESSLLCSLVINCCLSVNRLRLESWRCSNRTKLLSNWISVDRARKQELGSNNNDNWGAFLPSVCWQIATRGYYYFSCMKEKAQMKKKRRKMREEEKREICRYIAYETVASFLSLPHSLVLFLCQSATPLSCSVYACTHSRTHTHTHARRRNIVLFVVAVFACCLFFHLSVYCVLSAPPPRSSQEKRKTRQLIGSNTFPKASFDFFDKRATQAVVDRVRSTNNRQRHGNRTKVSCHAITVMNINHTYVKIQAKSLIIDERKENWQTTPGCLLLTSLKAAWLDELCMSCFVTSRHEIRSTCRCDSDENWFVSEKRVLDYADYTVLLSFIIIINTPRRETTIMIVSVSSSARLTANKLKIPACQIEGDREAPLN